MFLISLTHIEEGWYEGWIQDGDHYQAFEHYHKVFRLKEPKVLVDQYDSYEHFVGVMSKFVPEVFFFQEKEYVSSLSLRTLTRIVQERGIVIDTY